MTDKQTVNSLGSSSLSQAKLASSSQIQPKQCRVSVSRPQHQELLRSVSAQLGSNNLRDGLEHILNCWLVGNVPTTTPPISAPIQPTEEIDEFDSLCSFE